MKLIVAVALAIMVSAAPMPAPADDARERTHNQWESRILNLEGKIWYRAFTTYRNGNVIVLLTLDRPATDCSRQFISMNILGNKPANQTMTSNAMNGLMQVDNKNIHNITFTISFEEGSQTFFVNVRDFDGDDSLLDELTGGQRLWFKLTVEGEDFYMAFSLMGFTAAQTRTLGLCMNGGQEPAPPPKPKAKPKPPAPAPEINPF